MVPNLDTAKKGGNTMTTREQLKLMDEIRKKNDASIAKYIEQMRVEAASHTTEQTAMTQGQEA
jgi:hypothetical protein